MMPNTTAMQTSRSHFNPVLKGTFFFPFSVCSSIVTLPFLRGNSCAGKVKVSQNQILQFTIDNPAFLAYNSTIFTRKWKKG